MARDLEDRLGGPPPPAVAELGPEALAHLERLMRDAEQRQLDELTQALEGTLRIVPPPLRGVIRKVVGAP